jgi:hypothetical protein
VQYACLPLALQPAPPPPPPRISVKPYSNSPSTPPLYILTMHSLCTHYALTMHCITPYSTTASHSTPLHTTPLCRCSLIHVDPRWARRCLHAICCTTARGAGMLGSSLPVQCCALVQGDGSGSAIYVSRRHHHIERLHLQRKHCGTRSIGCFE